ncbi:MAG: glycosyltransferase family 39 protein, partial [Planctomycetota bacterium]
MPRALLHLLLWGAFLRFVNLGTWSLWLDEGATWSWAVRPTWGGTILAEANHPPAWWIVTRLWIGVFGDSEFALRAPSAILGVLTIWLGWRLGLRLLDPAHAPHHGGFPTEGNRREGRSAALWFAGLLAMSSYLLEYAQEARMYAALIAVGLGLTLLYLRWLDHGDRTSLVAYALLAALGLYTHYFAVWPVAGHAAHALWCARRSRSEPHPVRAGPFLAACTAAGLLFVPWFVHLVTHYEGIAAQVQEPFGLIGYAIWRVGAGPAFVVVDRLRQQAGVGAVAAEESTVILVTGVLWLLPLVSGVWQMRRRAGLRSLVVACFVVPLGLLLAVYPFFPLIHERYLVFLAPWLFLVAAVGARQAPRLLRPVLLGALVVLTIAGTAAYHMSSQDLVREGRGPVLDGVPTPTACMPDRETPFDFLQHGHPYGREPWRQAHAFVAQHSRAERENARGDLVLLHPEYLPLVWDYYDRRRLDRIPLPRETLDAAAVRALIEEAVQGRQRVFLVLANEETEDPDHYFEVVRSVLADLWLT